MPRMRTVKHEFFTSSQIAECSRDARLTFIGLLCFSDDSGIHPADTRRLKMEVFPADNCSKSEVAKWVTELICVGLVEEYEVDGEKWWRITGFLRHQTTKYPSFRYPLPDGTIPPRGTKTPGGLREPSPNKDKDKDKDGRSVRPFVASDHFEKWPEARTRAASLAKRLWPGGRQEPSDEAARLERNRDTAELLKLAFLSLAVFTDGWLADAISAATAKRRGRKPIENRYGYFKGVLHKKAQTAGYDLNSLLDSIEIPSKRPGGESK